MKAQPLRLHAGAFTPCDPHDATHVRLHMPGCFPNRTIPVYFSGQPDTEGKWLWDGDTEKPTLSPSILTWDGPQRGTGNCCHSFVTNGEARFLSDCSHAFAGLTLTLLDVEE